MAFEYSVFVAGTVNRFADDTALVVGINGKAWDYVILPTTFQDMLNMMGRENWELVSTSTLMSTQQENDVFIMIEYVMRREYTPPLAPNG